MTLKELKDKKEFEELKQYYWEEMNSIFFERAEKKLNVTWWEKYFNLKHNELLDIAWKDFEEHFNKKLNNLEVKDNGNI